MARTLKTLIKQTEKIAELRGRYADAMLIANKFKEQYEALEARQLRDMLEADAQNVKSATTGAQHFVKRSTVPQADNWPKIDAFIYKKKAIDLLQRRLSVSAWRERADSGIVVPGTKEVEVISLGFRS